MQLRRGYKRSETEKESIQSSTKSAIDTQAVEERSPGGRQDRCGRERAQVGDRNPCRQEKMTCR